MGFRRRAALLALAASLGGFLPASAGQTSLGGPQPEIVPPPDPGKAEPPKKAARRPYRIGGRKARPDDPLGYWEYFRKNPGSLGFWGIVGTGGYTLRSMGAFGSASHGPQRASMGGFGIVDGKGARTASMGAFGLTGARPSRREYGMFGRDGTRPGDLEYGLFGRSGSRLQTCEDGLFGRPQLFRDRVRGIRYNLGLFGQKDAAAGHDNGLFGRAVAKKTGLKRAFSMNGLGTEGKPKSFDAGELGLERTKGVRSTLGTMGQEVDAGTPEPKGLFGVADERFGARPEAKAVKPPTVAPRPNPALLMDAELRKRLDRIAKRGILGHGTR